MNLQIICETEFVYLFLCAVDVLYITTFIFVKKNRRFVVTKLVKLSDEFVTNQIIFEKVCV